MTMSIVERLRRLYRTHPMVVEAADTIEELVETLRFARCACHGCLLDRVDALLAKIGGDV